MFGGLRRLAPPRHRRSGHHPRRRGPRRPRRRRGRRRDLLDRRPPSSWTGPPRLDADGALRRGVGSRSGSVVVGRARPPPPDALPLGRRRRVPRRPAALRPRRPELPRRPARGGGAGQPAARRPRRADHRDGAARGQLGDGAPDRRRRPSRRTGRGGARRRLPDERRRRRHHPARPRGTRDPRHPSAPAAPRRRPRRHHPRRQRLRGADGDAHHRRGWPRRRGGPARGLPARRPRRAPRHPVAAAPAGAADHALAARPRPPLPPDGRRHRARARHRGELAAARAPPDRQPAASHPPRRGAPVPRARRQPAADARPQPARARSPAPGLPRRADRAPQSRAAARAGRRCRGRSAG